ncbi:MAG TPA: DMT family transporter [Candidatus Acidoferrum sp.]|nr:DMT family transporter [Candidatus Acidoferrum sp.]
MSRDAERPQPPPSTTPRAGRHHLPVPAALLMTAAILAFSVQDAAIKWLSKDYGLAQIIFFSRILAVPLAVLLAHRSGGLAQLRPKRPLLHVLRASFTVCDMLCFTAAVWLMPLADAITIGFAAPLFMTMLSVPLLKERVGPRRWTAVLCGFIGVVIVLQPSGAGLGPASFYALGSALAFAILIILTRTLTASEAVPCMMFWNSGLVATVMLVLMLPHWHTPSGWGIWVFLLSAGIGAVAQLLITEAFRLGEVSLLAPIQYTSLLWASFFGYAIFGDAPTPMLLLGAAVIVASTLYIVEREARLARLRGKAARDQVLGSPEAEVIIVKREDGP